MDRMDFSVEDGGLDGLKVITPFYEEDDRGYFLKSFEQQVYSSLGLENEISEDFESFSRKGVIRGMHFQARKPQIKAVRVIMGEVHDIAVDLRLGSPTFGRYADFILSDQNHLILWIPKGFAHGFEVLSENAVMSYKCIGKYEAGYDSGILWNDHELNLPWQTRNPVVSVRDSRLQTLGEFLGGRGIEM